MAFTDVAWTNRDTITETKLDQMVANEQHVREELNSRVLVTVPRHITPAGVSTGSTGNLKWYADATLLDTVALVGTWADYSSVNKSVSSLSAGLHTLRIDLCSDSIVLDFLTFRMERVSDLAYVSLWVRARHVLDGGDWFPEVKGLTILGHRTSKSW